MIREYRVPAEVNAERFELPSKPADPVPVANAGAVEEMAYAELAVAGGRNEAAGAPVRARPVNLTGLRAKQESCT